MSNPGPDVPSPEWATLAVAGLCYGAWACGTTVLADLWLPGGIVLTTLAIALYSSLQHEILHGHPFRNRLLNEILVFPGLTLFIPYLRFRDQHIEHHNDSHLTDPYDDPESNYLDPAVWARLPGPVRRILRFNNTLLGRLLVGPAVSMVGFVSGDMRAIARGDRAALTGWLWHIPSLGLVWIWLTYFAAMPIWAYILAAYFGLSILKIRTFLEHRAYDDVGGRTVIIEGQCPLSFLFLNNSLHAIHHAKPWVPWYRLPATYRQDRARYAAGNDHYLYRSYAEIFRRYFIRAKDPVPHPLWRRDP